MTSVAYVEEQVQYVLGRRANELARETGCIVRQRKFDGATLVQTLLFGFQQHVHASLEQLASTAQVRAVSVTDSAVDKRFSEACARFLHAALEEMSTVVVQAAQAVPLSLLTRFSAVICEDSSTITLPDELADLWQGCGGNQAHTKAAVKVHTRWDLTRGRVWGPKLTSGRTSDRSSPFNGEQMATNTLYIADLGYFSVPRFVARREAGSYTLSRLQAGTVLFTPEGEALCLELVLPKHVGQLKELEVLVGARKQHPMRLLLLRVPKAVGDKRRKDLLEDARRRGQTVSEQTLRLADWTVLVTDVSRDMQRFEEALVLLRERWQMELLYKLWNSTHRWTSGIPVTPGVSCVSCMPNCWVSRCNTGSSSCLPGTTRNAAWSNWHRSYAIPAGASWRRWLAFAPCARPCDWSSGGCSPAVR